jgi:uncharacterized protein
MHPYLLSFIGGTLIGAAAWLLLNGLGRIAGVSGIVAESVVNPASSGWRFAFVAGLLAGGLVFGRAFSVGTLPVAPLPWLLLAGLLVGVGTVLGSGCTSGHGVCGIARGSPRSLVATVTFMTFGIITVAVIHALK